MAPLIESLQMAVIAMFSVGLWTLRVALTAKGRKVAGSVVAGVEALVFLLAFSAVLGDLDAAEKIAGYAVGVAGGTLLGMYLDERLSNGQSEVRVVTEGPDLTLVDRLHAGGWPATWAHAEGPTGVVTVAFVAVDDMRLPALLKELERVVPDAFWTVEQLKRARAVKSHEGWVQVGGPFALRAGWRSRRETGSATVS
jgi:uncharacterized protein YebE (UPF0316 family)